MKILIVDDSVVFRTQITNALAAVPGVEIVGTASNGRIALQRISQQPVELMTLDMEMPELDGMETLKILRAQNKDIKVIVFSSQTVRGAEKALEALRAGADDVVAKPSGDNLNFETALDAVKTALVPKVLQFMEKKTEASTPRESLSQKPTISEPIKPEGSFNDQKKLDLRTTNPKAIVIASSTGGPTALEAIFSKIPGPYKIPVLIAQHMPPVFTQILAKRIGDLTGVPSREAVHGEAIQPNNIYFAPGDYHLRIQKMNSFYFTHLAKDDLRNSVRPSADYLFESAAETYQKNLLGVILTGMGEDGKDGAKAIKRAEGGILLQNKESCTVYGMPRAAFDAGAYDQTSDLDGIRDLLTHFLKG